MNDADNPFGENRISFWLGSSRLVWVTNFSYSETYAGLLDGWPSGDLNERTIEYALASAAAHMVPSAPVYMIPPLRVAVPDHILAGYETYRTQSKALFKRPAPTPSLPPIRCIAHLESGPLSSSFCGSSLKVVWFEMPFFNAPLMEMLAASLKDIPWEKSARDFNV